MNLWPSQKSEHRRQTEQDIEYQPSDYDPLKYRTSRHSKTSLIFSMSLLQKDSLGNALFLVALKIVSFPTSMPTQYPSI